MLGSVYNFSKPNSREKGTLVIKRLLRNLGVYDLGFRHSGFGIGTMIRFGGVGG